MIKIADLTISKNNKKNSAGKAPDSDQGQSRCGSVVDQIQSDNFSEAINKLAHFWTAANYPSLSSPFFGRNHTCPNNLVIPNFCMFKKGVKIRDHWAQFRNQAKLISADRRKFQRLR